MSDDDPTERSRRDPAPPYEGEGPFALWHFSEDPSLGVLHPHVPSTNPDAAPYVWAVDTRHAPMFWFPRDCPRGCVWLASTTTPEDRALFFGLTDASRMHVTELDWLARIRACRLYAYRLPDASFRPHGVGGYWISDDMVEAQERVEVGDLLGRHADARIELRLAPSIWPFWRRVASSTLGFSGLRLANAQPGSEPGA
jgi:hypothetical protein